LGQARVRGFPADAVSSITLKLLGKVPGTRTKSPELDYARQRGKVTSVPQHVSLSNQGCKVGFGTIAAALAALSMAVLGHFFI
jgi:hypothetical protein